MIEIRKEIPQQAITKQAFSQEVKVNKVGGKFVNPRAGERIKKESAHTLAELYAPYWQAFLNENPGAQIARGQVGEPEEVPHYEIRKAGADALLDGKKEDVGYMSPQGLFKIRQGVADYYNEVVPHIFKSKVIPERVVWTGPGKTALNAVSIAGAQPIVAVKEPCYVGELSAAKKSYLQYAHDGVEYGLLALPQPFENGGHFDINEVHNRIYTKKPGMFILDEPGNPGTTTFNEEEVKLIDDYVEDMAKTGHDVLKVVDGAYDRLIYDGKKLNPLADANKVYVQNTSKTWRFTGLRGGIIIFQEGQEDLQSSTTDQLNDAFGPGNTPLGVAMLPAFTREGDKATQEYVKSYEDKRNKVRDALDKNGFEHGPMEATFYVQIKVPEGFANAHEFGIWTARNAGLGVLPGQVGEEIDIYTGKNFNPKGDKTVRLSYGENLNKLLPAIDRWGNALNGALKPKKI